MKNYIVYFRVSTKKQGKSGLGLSAQRTIVENYINNQEQGVILNEYTDIETGTNKKVRVELTNAIQEAKQTSSTLLIAKLDRLSRNVFFTSQLLNSKVDFVACDIPEANKFTIHILSALAEQEAELISQRTKQALQELIKKGKKLGTPENLNDEARQKSIEVRKENALNNDNNKRATELILLLREKDISWRSIASRLNEAGYKTRRNKLFTFKQAQILFERATN